MPPTAPDIRPGRLPRELLRDNFADIHPPLSPAEALVEADRCYFCFDAPCTTACPTGIDIPQFIQRIRSHNLEGAAQSILRENILGGMCARVCPTEVLCEEACVRNVQADKPVEIGLLQRHATDPTLAAGRQLFPRADASGKRAAVVGAGPARLACAHHLARLGHDVMVFDARNIPGGLNEHGIAAYKTVDDFARQEVDYVLGIGGIELRTGQALGADFTLQDLLDAHDAVFLGLGLGDVNRLGIEGDDLPGMEDAVRYIERLRRADDLSALPVARTVLVIGGGMTAIDIAVQSRRLGAEHVDIVYRRGAEHMGASPEEQRFAQVNGVRIRHWARPVAVLGDDTVRGMRFEGTRLDGNGALHGTGKTFELAADVVFRAVGQALASLPDLESLEREGRKLRVDEHGRTSRSGVWAGGDCVAAGDDLTVTAVQQGKLAALDMDRALRGED